jgi:hypothetical protein
MAAFVRRKLGVLDSSGESVAPLSSEVRPSGQLKAA